MTSAAEGSGPRAEKQAGILVIEQRHVRQTMAVGNSGQVFEHHLRLAFLLVVEAQRQRRQRVECGTALRMAQRHFLPESRRGHRGNQRNRHQPNHTEQPTHGPPCNNLTIG
jgi:hypothetical protein